MKENKSIGNIIERSKLKYVEDYTTELYEDEKGRTREKIVYVGPLVKTLEPQKNVRVKSVIATLLAALELFCQYRFITVNHSSMSWFLTVIPLAISLFAGLYLIMGLSKLPFWGQDMKRDSYLNGIIRVIKSAAGIAVCVTVSLVGEALYRLINHDTLFLTDDFWFYGYTIGSILLCIVIVLIIRSIRIDERELYTK